MMLTLHYQSGNMMWKIIWCWIIMFHVFGCSGLCVCERDECLHSSHFYTLNHFLISGVWRRITQLQSPECNVMTLLWSLPLGLNEAPAITCCHAIYVYRHRQLYGQMGLETVIDSKRFFNLAHTSSDMFRPLVLIHSYLIHSKSRIQL